MNYKLNQRIISHEFVSRFVYEFMSTLIYIQVNCQILVYHLIYKYHQPFREVFAGWVEQEFNLLTIYLHWTGCRFSSRQMRKPANVIKEDWDKQLATIQICFHVFPTTSKMAGLTLYYPKCFTVV